MYIADNVLAHHLRNVYWVSGTACAGKTTVAEALAKKLGFHFYSADEMYEKHRKLAYPQWQPSMCRQFPDLRSWFTQPLEEYHQGMNTNHREELDMIIMDLVALAQNQPVIIEGSFEPGWLQDIVPPERFAFLYAEPQVVRRDFFDREDKRDVLDAINSLPDGEKVREHVLDVVEYGTREWIKKARKYGVMMLERTREVSVDQRVKILATHFCLGG